MWHEVPQNFQMRMEMFCTPETCPKCVGQCSSLGEVGLELEVFPPLIRNDIESCKILIGQMREGEGLLIMKLYASNAKAIKSNSHLVAASSL